MRANVFCARVESPVRNRLSVSVLPFCVRFSRKANVYKSFVRRDWYKPTWRSGIICCRHIAGKLLESALSQSTVS